MRNTLIARKKSEETLRLLLESTAEGILAADLQGACTFCNPAAFRMLDYPNAESILGKNLHALVHSSRADGPALPESECRIFNTTRTGESTHVEDEVFWQRSGKSLPVEYWARPIVNDGQVTGTVVAFHDITTRKQAQAALEEKTLQLQALFDNARDAVVVQDDSGHVMEVNQAAAELFGIAKDHFVGRDIRESMEPGYPFDELWESFLRTGNHYMGQRTLLRPDGKRRVVDVSATANFLPGRHLAMYRDVTEQQELETRLLQSQKMEAIGRLAGGIAHDFNNLLNVIGGYSELLQMGFEEGTIQYGYADKAMLATRKAAALTRQLLAFSRQQLLAPAVLDLNPVIKELAKMLPRLIGEDIDLILSLHKDLDHVKVDASQLEQVILNLVVNARDAMPKGGKLIIETRNAKLDESYASSRHPVKPGDYVLIAMTDNGVGMSKQVQDRIFEPFFTTKEQGKGTGLGLSTVYGIVKQSNGFVWVYSEEGRGTAFKIYLPAVREPVSAASPEMPLEEVAPGTETVLLVEDEDFLRAVVREYLANCGYTVLEAANGLDALRVSQEYQGRIHLLLTDVVMPKISGRDLATQICNTRSGLEVIYVSGYTEDTIAHHGVLDPGLNFIQKPYTLHSLGRTLRKVLDQKARLMSLPTTPGDNAKE
jgi:two-component system, cell cycle sensor histidine kinase and response regulator CckA